MSHKVNDEIMERLNEEYQDTDHDVIWEALPPKLQDRVDERYPLDDQSDQHMEYAYELFLDMKFDQVEATQ